MQTERSLKCYFSLNKLRLTPSWSTVNAYLNVAVYFHFHTGRRVSLRCVFYNGPKRGKVKCLVAGYRNKDPIAL
jgi:hypothetical protein